MAERFQEGSCHSRERFAYEVFLSFRGEDVRKSFIDHLHQALKQRGFSTFHDDSALERGSCIQSNLYEGIRTSKLSIVTFSSRYATSRWCLDELVEIVKCTKHGHIVLPVFYGIDPTFVRNQSGPYKEAFDVHEVRFRDELERVEGWKQALRYVADTAGFCLQNQANGYEAQFVKHIVLEVVNKLDTRQLSVSKYIVGTESLVQDISKWLQNGSSEVEVGIIYGLGGVGKTTAAKVVYNSYYDQFESSSFLAGIRSASRKDSHLIQLQEQLISDISRNEPVKIYNVHNGREKIRKVIGNKKILVVLDDVDEVKQLHAMFDWPEWFFPGSKILLTTRNQHLLRGHGASVVKFSAKILNVEESTELFYHHAFSQGYPSQDYVKMSALFIEYCDGLPLALEVLASSLCDNEFKMWAYQFEKLKNFPDKTVHNVLKLSFDSIDDRNDEDIFLHIAFFMVGMKKDHALMILDGCNLHGEIGLENLIKKCLVSVEEARGILMMHHLVQQMGYEVVREKASELGQRSRLLGHNDTTEVLLKKTGTSAIKGLHLDIPDSKGDISAEHSINSMPRAVIPANRSRRPPHRARPIKTSAFSKMCNLDILLLENVQHEGDFEDFPKSIKWLSWRGFSLKSIPLDFELDDLVVLDMQKSSLVHAWVGSKYMWELRVLNLSHSHQLEKSPDLSSAVNLERLYLEGCRNLIELHESIGSLDNLTHLNLKGCSALVGMPISFEKLKMLTVLNLEGCVNLRRFSVDKLSSLKQLNLNDCWSFFMVPDPLESSVISLSSPNALPHQMENLSTASSPPKPLRQPLSFYLPCLEELYLARCGASDDNVLEWLKCASALRILDLSGNPIRVLNNKQMSTFPLLDMILLENCTNLETISQLPHRPYMSLGNCSSLKKISYLYEPGGLFHYSAYPGCVELVEIDHGCDTIQVFEWTYDMNGSQATTLGFPNLDTFDSESNLEFPVGNFDFGKGNYLGGTYQVYLPGDHLAKWFPMITTAAKLHYSVPSNPLPIRGLNLGFMVSADHREFHISAIEIKNLTSTWKWTLRSWGDWRANENHDIKVTWLSHWCVMKHREIKPGDQLSISIDLHDNYLVDWGIKIIYEESELHDVDDDEGEPRVTGDSCSSHGSEGQIINIHDKMNKYSRNEQNGKEEEDDSVADVALWYNNTFRSPDLSFYKYIKDNDDDKDEDEDYKSRTYEIFSHINI